MSDKLVANELLAFLQQKLDVMDEVSAIQICATNFSEDEIAAAKLLLFRLLNKSDQMVSRRRDGTKKSLQDIITLLKETDPDDVPTFVAKDLYKLPPVTFDHVDVTSLLKDIVFLKTSLVDVNRKLEESQKTVTDLRMELNELRNTVTVTGSPARVVSNVNTRRGACLDTSVASFASAVLTPQSAVCAVRGPSSPSPVPAATPLVVARASRTADLPVTRSTPVAPATKSMPEKATNRTNEDGFVMVQKRKRQQRTVKNCCGTGPVEPGVNLRAAAPNTPVYISRLHYTTKAEDIAEYVCKKIKYRPRVQLLEARRNVNFKAFVVRVPTCYLHLVMEQNFWPNGVVFRRFRGQIPRERTTT